jgi:ketopantoate hydroxymethyltransferase
VPPTTEHEPCYDPLAKPEWLDCDGIDILGTPYGSPEFVEAYLNDKLIKHKELLSFIKDVAKMGYPREAHMMLT